MLLAGDQAQMAFGYGDGRLAQHAPQAWHPHGAFDGLAQKAQMARAAQLVEHHSGERQGRIKILKALDEGRGAARHAAGIHHQEHGQAQPLGHLGGGAVFGFAVITVIEAHHAFDDGDVGIGARCAEGIPIVLPRQHPAVQIAAGPPGDASMVAGVDKVRTDLERRHHQAAALEGRHQTEAHGGLAAPAVGARDDDGFQFRASFMISRAFSGKSSG